MFEVELKNLSVPEKKIDVILDTDAYNEIDDQFALAYLLKKEKLNCVGICAAPFLNSRSVSPSDGMEKSYDEIIKLLELMDRDDMKDKVFKGSNCGILCNCHTLCCIVVAFRENPAAVFSCICN